MELWRFGFITYSIFQKSGGIVGGEGLGSGGARALWHWRVIKYQSLVSLLCIYCSEMGLVCLLWYLRLSDILTFQRQTEILLLHDV